MWHVSSVWQAVIGNQLQYLCGMLQYQQLKFKDGDEIMGDLMFGKLTNFPMMIVVALIVTAWFSFLSVVFFS